ncbi:hypothetical protein K445DRAFT_292613 [Daldinia sp. EC12]|nr:hypothetical protein K445DRAFT_292613 [Daldinia sp. EC12]
MYIPSTETYGRCCVNDSSPLKHSTTLVANNLSHQESDPKTRQPALHIVTYFFSSFFFSCLISSRLGDRSICGDSLNRSFRPFLY